MKPFKWLQSLLTHATNRGGAGEADLADREAFEQRLRTPDWDTVAKVLGEVPSSLRALYEAGDVIVQSYWEVVTGKPEDAGAYVIAEFEALRPRSRAEMWPELSEGCLSFAGNGFGNEFYLKTKTGPDWPVYYYDHEMGESTLLAKSLDGFLGMLRPMSRDEP